MVSPVSTHGRYHRFALSHWYQQLRNKSSKLTSIDCDISIVDALEIPQSLTKPSISATKKEETATYPHHSSSWSTWTRTRWLHSPHRPPHRRSNLYGVSVHRSRCLSTAPLSGTQAPLQERKKYGRWNYHWIYKSLCWALYAKET